MFDAFTFQNLLVGLEKSNTMIDFRTAILKFCEDMGLDYTNMDDNDMAYELIVTLSNNLDVGILKGNTECPKCNSSNCITSVDLKLVQYEGNQIKLETDSFILTFKRNFIEEDISLLQYISESMDEILIKSTGEKYKINEIENIDDIDNILSYITEQEIDRLTDDMVKGGVVIHANDKCSDCEYSSSYGVFNAEDIINLIIQGYLENE